MRSCLFRVGSKSSKTGVFIGRGKSGHKNRNRKEDHEKTEAEIGVMHS